MLLIGRERGKGPTGRISGESLDKSGKSRKKRTKKDRKGRTSPDWETPPRLKPPRLAALENQAIRANLRIDSRESGHLSMMVIPDPILLSVFNSNLQVVPSWFSFPLENIFWKMSSGMAKMSKRGQPPYINIHRTHHCLATFS